MEKEVIQKAFKESWNWQNIKAIYGTSLLTAIGGLFLLKKECNWTYTDSTLTALGFGFLILLSTFVYYTIKFNSESRKEKENGKNFAFGEMIIGLRDLFIRINGLKTLWPNIDKEHFKSVMQYVCDKLKDIYEKRTGVHCGVSIKMFVYDDNVFGKAPDVRISSVTNLITDKVTAESPHRNGLEYQKIKHHPIIKNTAFKKIVDAFYSDKDDELFHLHNELPVDMGYESTSFKAHGGDKRTKKMTKAEMRNNWALPYRAEIVVPIFSALDSYDKKSSTWAGFLCIDAAKENAFHPIYDVQALIGVSEGIFDLFQCHYQMHETEKFLPKAYQNAQKTIQKQSIPKSTSPKVKRVKK